MHNAMCKHTLQRPAIIPAKPITEMICPLRSPLLQLLHAFIVWYSPRSCVPLSQLLAQGSYLRSGLQTSDDA